MSKKLKLKKCIKLCLRKMKRKRRKCNHHHKCRRHQFTPVLQVNCQHHHEPKHPEQSNHCVCGRIFHTCDGSEHTYFTSVIPTGRAVARIQNDSACSMKAVFETRCRQICQTIERGQQVVVVLPSLKEMVIVCGEYCHKGGPACQGTFDIQWCE